MLKSEVYIHRLLLKCVHMILFASFDPTEAAMQDAFKHGNYHRGFMIVVCDNRHDIIYLYGTPLFKVFSRPGGKATIESMAHSPPRPHSAHNPPPIWNANTPCIPSFIMEMEPVGRKVNGAKMTMSPEQAFDHDARYFFRELTGLFLHNIYDETFTIDVDDDKLYDDINKIINDQVRKEDMMGLKNRYTDDYEKMVKKNV